MRRCPGCIQHSDTGPETDLQTSVWQGRGTRLGWETPGPQRVQQRVAHGRRLGPETFLEKDLFTLFEDLERPCITYQDLPNGALFEGGG